MLKAAEIADALMFGTEVDLGETREGARIIVHCGERARVWEIRAPEQCAGTLQCLQEDPLKRHLIMTVHDPESGGVSLLFAQELHRETVPEVERREAIGNEGSPRASKAVRSAA